MNSKFQPSKTPFVIWFTGLSGSGKTTLAHALINFFNEHEHNVALLDGDTLRNGLNKDLGFTDQDRRENIRRVGEIAALFASNKVSSITSLISPFRTDRAKVREMLREFRFIEVYLSTPFSICETRDCKGLYKKARAGLIPNFTGIDSAYEPPDKPEIIIDTSMFDIPTCVEIIVSHLSD